MAHILILDNYDSFTYNLVHYVRDYGHHSFDVFRNDEIDLDEVDKYDGIILSPGPGIPTEAGNLLPIIKQFSSKKRIFGVCLGLQAIAESFGGTLINMDKVYHGVATPIKQSTPSHYIFNGMPNEFEGGRYHSWSVDPENLPSSITVDAVDGNGQIMAISHKEFDVCGVQFHPESILTPLGKQIIFNWMKRFN